MMKAFIVDDEPLARDELKYLLLRTREVEVTGEASNIADSLPQIKQTKPDLVFLDIELSEESGLELAAEIRHLEHKPAIVFATAYDEFALQAFELNAIDYVLKPFDENRINQTIDKIKTIRMIGGQRSDILAEMPKPSAELQTGKLAVAADERIVLIDREAILYTASSEGKTLIKTMSSEYKTQESLTAIEKKLSSSAFVRVHRSFLVNINHIDQIEPWFNSTYNLIMKDGSKVPVSRTYVKELKQLIGF
ncbi:LytTR family transcriptional regulator DNA-binding domain-containing protein [Domibacillus indicus]|uniref:LytR/AlgR family response regulator transcription factor n=1 Tax=Domibacillus indicus TaxID=1437523 RepID=UPI0020422D1A|nr:LytTR family transcriptional regulator DNA-binding domain-containing protein [Domibacillus indicus]MCM3791077.1 LytTR family transcriptional regulator DNA-binding domain-containing protein [Domibacillus indicus]